MIGKIKYALYGPKLHAYNFILSHTDDTLLKTMPDVNQAVGRTIAAGHVALALAVFTFLCSLLLSLA